MSEMRLPTPEEWARVVALLPKLRAKKAKMDKVKTKDLNKQSKAELIEAIKSISLDEKRHGS